MALALYRRYRPDTFDGVIGQDQVTIPLMRALDEGRLTHAYLFSGPRGCGKTSSARILARCINCEKGPTSHPCGECESCKDLATGGPGSIDVVEIDAASHNGVDDARELRERAGFAPARDRYKIFILDEAHMVTQQGFNALLKIVEEPPEHVMFIFATTEPDKVIGTIRSRTHHYPFRLVPQEVMGPYLETVCAKESIKPETGVLNLAMRAGGGSVRDTLSVLDQLMVGAVDGVISHDSAIALLGFTPGALIGEAIDAVIDRNGEALYGVIQKVVVGGFDPRRFVEDLLARVRDLLVLTLAGERAESVLSDTAEGENMAELQRQASALGLSALTAMAETINETLGNMTGAISPRMRLELLAARLLAGRESGYDAASSGAEGSGDGVNGVRVSAGGAGSAGGASSAARRGGFAGSSRGFAGATRNRQPAGVAEPSGGRAEGGTDVRNIPTAAESPAPAVASQDPRQPAGGPRAAEDASDQAPIVASAARTQPAQPVQPASAAQPGESAKNGGNAAAATSEPASPASASASPASPASAEAARPASEGTPDERWDALVAGLPQDVRRYVGRDRVPRINLAANPKNGRMQLWIKFDEPLSKYAFAMAVAGESVDGATKVVDILRAEVRKAFGPEVALAPTQKMADGQLAPPLSKLSAGEQQRIKAQLLQENLKAATLAMKNAGEQGDGQAVDRADSASPASPDTASDDDDAHRNPSGSAAGSTAVSYVSSDAQDDDPWAGSAAQHTAQTPNGSENRKSAEAAQGKNGGATGVTAGAPADVGAVSSERPHKHVAVPDISDGADPWAASVSATVPSDDDPWASPVGAVSGARSNPESEASVAADPNGKPSGSTPQAPSVFAPEDDDPWAQPVSPQPVSSFQSVPSSPSAPGRPSGDVFGGGVETSSEAADSGRFAESSAFHPQVDPDDDEYSMNDESLGSATAMSVDELTKFFEVKKVEDFAADDPKNPRNLAQSNKRDD